MLLNSVETTIQNTASASRIAKTKKTILRSVLCGMGNRVKCRVEFYGIPRARAGVAEITVEGESVGDLLEAIAHRYPRLGETCIDGRVLKAGYTLNLGGQRFLTDPDFRPSDGDVFLFMSLDAGG